MHPRLEPTYIERASSVLTRKEHDERLRSVGNPPLSQTVSEEAVKHIGMTTYSAGEVDTGLLSGGGKMTVQTHKRATVQKKTRKLFTKINTEAVAVDELGKKVSRGTISSLGPSPRGHIIRGASVTSTKNVENLPVIGIRGKSNPRI